MKNYISHIKLIAIAAIFTLASSCSTKSSCLKEPKGTYLSENGNFEKLVFQDNNRVYLYKNSETIIYTSFKMKDEELVINIDQDLSFEVLCDKTIVEKGNKKPAKYYRLNEPNLK
jgi:hypothetical protein